MRKTQIIAALLLTVLLVLGACAKSAPTSTPMPPAEETPAPAPEPTPAPAPSAAPTPTPATIEVELEVDSSSSEGVKFIAPQSGLYKITIAEGAYCQLYPQDIKTWSIYGGWRSKIALYINRPVEWGARDKWGLHPINPDNVIGTDESYPTIAGAEAAGQGLSIMVDLDKNDYVIALVRDGSDCYYDNAGIVKICVTGPPAPIPTPAPTPPPAKIDKTAVPAIRDFAIYPEDKVAIERAEGDIELNRKGDVFLTITDSQGSPTPGLSVKYELVNRSFLFGIFGNYNKKAFELLKDAGIDYATLHLNWRAVEPRKDIYTFDWLSVHYHSLYYKDFRLRGHALLWLNDETTPGYLMTLSFDEYKAAVYQHVFNTVSHFKERIKLWDAINEPMEKWANVMDFSEAQVTEVIQIAIQAIRDAQPDAVIFINNATPASGHEYTFLRKLNKAGIAYDIVGLQFYYNGYTKDIVFERLTLAQIGEVVDHYSTLGKEIHITEFSVPSAALLGRLGYWEEDWDEDLQAAYLKAAYTIFFSKPKVQSITWWDSYDHAGTFIYHGGLFNESLQPKKAYYVLKELLSRWSTRGNVTTDNEGRAFFRGFGGEYRVTITDPKANTSIETSIVIYEQTANSYVIEFPSQ